MTHNAQIHTTHDIERALKDATHPAALAAEYASILAGNQIERRLLAEKDGKLARILLSYDDKSRQVAHYLAPFFAETEEGIPLLRRMKHFLAEHHDHNPSKMQVRGLILKLNERDNPFNPLTTEELVTTALELSNKGGPAAAFAIEQMLHRAKNGAWALQTEVNRSHSLNGTTTLRNFLEYTRNNSLGELEREAGIESPHDHDDNDFPTEHMGHHHDHDDGQGTHKRSRHR